MNNDVFLALWRRWNPKYELRAYKIVRKGFRDLAQAIPLDNLTRNNAEILIGLHVTESGIRDIITKVWAEIGLIHGRRTITQIENELGEKNRPLFNDTYQRELIRYINRYAGYRIKIMQQTYAEFLLKIIATMFENELTGDLATIRRQISIVFRSAGFYNYQIARIARTETTGAANYGAIQAGKSTGIRQQKVWITNPDERTRRRPEDRFDHVIMDGVSIGVDELFEQGGVTLAFPGDPDAQPRGDSAGMVINCRCAVSVAPMRDENGRLVLS